jgi:hypothetical protein
MTLPVNSNDVFGITLWLLVQVVMLWFGYQRIKQRRLLRAKQQVAVRTYYRMMQEPRP